MKEAQIQWHCDERGSILLDQLKSHTIDGVAIVGSRAADSMGISWAKRVTKSAVQRKMMVVSGGARGIDECVHRTAVKEGGMTIAVLGTGMQHLSRRHLQLANLGVGLISPFPDHIPPARWRFPKRNQIMSTLIKSVVVIQAADQSGSLYTARSALKAGKEVWVLTHLPDHTLHQGCLQLITEGAKPLTHDGAWASHLPMYEEGSKETRLEPNSPLLKVASFEPKTLTELAKAAGLSYSDALSQATLLELEGWLVPLSGDYFVKAHGV